MTDKAECPQCHGFGGGYVRTGSGDQWDSETCDWCFGTGYIPAALAAALRARDTQLAVARDALEAALHKALLTMNAVVSSPVVHQHNVIMLREGIADARAALDALARAR